MPIPRWWQEQADRELWHGVFQGGGAKGVAYVGALKAVSEQRCWFRAVAGSSAGAITACLVAAGLTPDQMEARSAEGLARLHKARWWHHVDAVLGGDRPLYGTADLRQWVEQLLREQVVHLSGAPRIDSESDVTFGELFAASGIDLFVVLLDADGGSPVVLNHTNAAGTQVSWAVVASSAIPIALPKQRLVMAGEANYWRQSRMFDGGAWSNYPRFVFADASFRAFRGLDPVPDQERIVGFVLRVASEDPTLVLDQPGEFVGKTQVRQRLPKPQRRGARWRSYCAEIGGGFAFATILNLLYSGHPLYSGRAALITLGLALPLLVLGRKEILRTFMETLEILTSTRLMRAILLGSVTLCFGLSLRSLHQLRDTFGPQSFENSTLGGLWPAITFFLMFAVPAAIVIVVAVLLALFRFQTFLLFDATAVLGASLGAALKVPVWAGAGAADHVVFVPVEPAVGTTDFDLSESTRNAVITRAYAATHERLVQILAVPPQASSAPERMALEPASLPTSEEMNPPDPPGSWLWLAAFGFGIVAIFLGFFTYAVWTNEQAGVPPHGVSSKVLLAVTAGAALGAALFACLGQLRSRPAAEGAEPGAK